MTTLIVTTGLARFGVVAELFLISTAASAERWVSGENSSCQIVCRAAGSTAFTSGRYTNGNEFAICSANTHSEGDRPGYNLEPNWANICVTGWGGREVANQHYLCMCK